MPYRSIRYRQTCPLRLTTCSMFIFSISLNAFAIQNPKKNTALNIRTPTPICLQQQAHTYRFDYQDQSRTPARLFGSGALSPQASKNDNQMRVELNLTGTFTAFCVKQQPYAVESITFNDVRLSQKGLASPKSLPLPSTSLFLVDKHNPALLFQTSIDPIFRNLVRSILSLQYFKPIQQTQWQIQRQDIHGHYTDSINRHSLNSIKQQQRFIAKNRVYTPPNIGSGIPQVQVETPSFIQYEFTKNILKQLTAKLNLNFTLNSLEAGSRQTTIRLSHISSSKVSRKNQLLATELYQKASANGALHDDLAGIAYQMYLDKKMHQQSLGNTTWKDLEALFMALTEDQMTEAFLKLKAFLILEPSMAQQAIEMLLGFSQDDSRFGLIALALAESGTPESQKALLEGFHRLQDNNDQIGLLRQAGLAKNPSLLLEQGFQDIAANTRDAQLKQTAHLALSNVALSIKQAEPKRYTALLSDAKQRLDSAQSYSELINVLNELGNFGSNEALDWAARFQKHPAPGIRATSLETLRFVKDSQAEKILLDRIQHDAHGLVQNTAAQELHYRQLSPQGLEQLQNILSNKPKERLKTLLLTSLSQHISQDSGIKQLLEHYKTQDPSKEIRLHAESLLTSIEP
jgi:hypothetical protein